MSAQTIAKDGVHPPKSDRLRDIVRVFTSVKWTLFELAWLLVFSSIAVALTLFYDSSFFAFTVYLAGIVCVVLAAKGHILNYVIGLYNCIGYGLLSLSNGLYGEMGLNFFFFAPMAVVGIAVWRRNLKKNRVRMRGLTPGRLFAVAALTAVLTWLAGLALSMIAGQNTPYLDAATNVLSVMATILMTWRFREQWLAYITLDVITVVMWSYRAVAGSPDGIIMVVMWSAYLTNAVYGWRVWSAGAAADALPAGVRDMETETETETGRVKGQ